jgi:hypothetical protein
MFLEQFFVEIAETKMHFDGFLIFCRWAGGCVCVCMMCVLVTAVSEVVLEHTEFTQRLIRLNAELYRKKAEV